MINLMFLYSSFVVILGMIAFVLDYVIVGQVLLRPPNRFTDWLLDITLAAVLLMVVFALLSAAELAGLRVL